MLLEATLENGHGSHTSTSHSDIRQLVRRTMRSYGEEMTTSLVDSTNDQIGTNMTLVLEEVLFEHGHGRHDLGFSAGRKGMELGSSTDAMVSYRLCVEGRRKGRAYLDVAADEVGDEFSVCGSSGTTTPDVIRNVMNLSTVGG